MNRIIVMVTIPNVTVVQIQDGQTNRIIIIISSSSISITISITLSLLSLLLSLLLLFVLMGRDDLQGLTECTRPAFEGTTATVFEGLQGIEAP